MKTGSALEESSRQGWLSDVEEVFDLLPADGEEGAEDAGGGAPRDGDDDEGVDAPQALGPGPAKELEEDGLGLVIQRVGGEDSIGFAGTEEVAEGLVADRAGGLFEGLAGDCGVGGYVGLMEVEGDVEVGAELLDEGLVGIGFPAADAVVDVDGGEADAEGGLLDRIGEMEGAEEGDGVGASGDGDADAVAGADLRSVEGEVVGWRAPVDRTVGKPILIASQVCSGKGEGSSFELAERQEPEGDDACSRFAI